MNGGHSRCGLLVLCHRGLLVPLLEVSSLWSLGCGLSIRIGYYAWSVLDAYGYGTRLPLCGFGLHGNEAFSWPLCAARHDVTCARSEHGTLLSYSA